MAKIERIFRDVQGTSFMSEHEAPQHSFLIYTDDSGHQQVLRGGQTVDGEGRRNLLDTSTIHKGDLLVIYDDNYFWDRQLTPEQNAPIDYDTSGNLNFHRYLEFEGPDATLSIIWKVMVSGGQIGSVLTTVSI